MAFALPTKKGQSLIVESIPKGEIISWKSFDEKGVIWFEGIFKNNDFSVIKTTDKSVSDRLQRILLACQEVNPSFLKNQGAYVETHLTFPRNWGLGTSSTLIYTIAQWATIDPFLLLEKTFGGSGYDIACAGEDEPIFYSRLNGEPKSFTFYFNPKFKDQLYFVFLGKKQNSREGITHYRKIKKAKDFFFEVSELSQEIATSKTLVNFEKKLNEHEELVSKTLKIQKAKDLYFSDYWGSIKSLGAWGGDFVLATSDRLEEETREYFNEKGFEVFLKYKDLIL